MFNNSSYANVRRDQKRLYARALATDLANPDFIQLADSFGVDGYRVNSPAELAPALSTAIEKDRPAVIEVVVDKEAEPSPWHLLVRFPER